MRKIDRFLQYLKYKSISENKATQECGLAQGIIHQAKIGKSDLGAKSIDKILIKYKDINRDWLISGIGEMIRQAEPTAEAVTIDKDVLKTIISQQETIHSQQKLLETLVTKTLQKDARPEDPAECADAAGA